MPHGWHGRKLHAKNVDYLQKPGFWVSLRAEALTLEGWVGCPTSGNLPTQRSEGEGAAKQSRDKYIQDCFVAPSTGSGLLAMTWESGSISLVPNRYFWAALNAPTG